MKCQNESSEPTKEPCYEGFSKDLIHAIAEDLKFEYKIVLAPDGKRGSRDPVTGKWNGIIKELQERVKKCEHSRQCYEILGNTCPAISYY
jgi:hypothetical protein